MLRIWSKRPNKDFVDFLVCGDCDTCEGCHKGETMNGKDIALSLIEGDPIPTAPQGSVDFAAKYADRAELTAADFKNQSEEEIDWVVNHQVFFGAKAEDIVKMVIVYPSEFEFKYGRNVRGYPNADEDRTTRNGQVISDLVKLSSSLGQGKPDENEIWCKKVFVDLDWFDPAGGER